MPPYVYGEGNKGKNRKSYFKELVHRIVEAGKSRIRRASQQAGDLGVPLANRKAPILQQWVQSLDVLVIGVLRIVFRVSSRAQLDLTLAFEELLTWWERLTAVTC